MICFFLFFYVGASCGQRERRRGQIHKQSERGKGPPEPLFEIFEIQTGVNCLADRTGRACLAVEHCSYRALYRSLLFNLYCQTASVLLLLLLLQMMERRRSRICVAVALFDG